MATGVPADVLTEVVTLKFQLIVKDFPIFFFLSVSLQDANFFANWQKSSFFSLSFLQWFSSSCFFFFHLFGLYMARKGVRGCYHACFELMKNILLF